jgi:hypothetical protein
VPDYSSRSAEEGAAVIAYIMMAGAGFLDWRGPDKSKSLSIDDYSHPFSISEELQCKNP